MEKSSGSDAGPLPQKRRRKTKKARRVRVLSSSSSSNEDCIIVKSDLKSSPVLVSNDVKSPSIESSSEDCIVIDNNVECPPIMIISSDEGEIKNDLQKNVTPRVVECVQIFSESDDDDAPQTPHKCTIPLSECVTISSSSDSETQA